MPAIAPFLERHTPALLNRARYLRHAVIGSEFVYQHITRAMFDAMGARALTAIDVGANVGIYSRYLSRYFRHTVAIEPMPQLVNLLRRSLPREVSVEQCALGDADGQIVIRTPVSAAGEPLLALTTASDRNDLSLFEHAAVNESTVPVRRLASLPCSGEKIGFIKIDVEGFENEVLRGSDDIIRRDMPVLQVEISRAHNPEYLDFIETIEAAGYRGYTLHERHLATNMREMIDRQPLRMDAAAPADCLFDFLFVPESRSSLAKPFLTRV